jgi:hypothetical protein
MNRRLGRRLVALLTAYALALNVLLPVLGAIAPQPAEAAVICGPGGTRPAPTAPTSPHQECPAACALTGCAGATGAALPGEAPVAVLPATWIEIDAVSLTPDGGLPVLQTGGRRLARGPPIA